MLEIIRESAPRLIRCAMFDFDGTVSLIRKGWQDVMAHFMAEQLLATPKHEAEPDLMRNVTALIVNTTGEPTVNQMQRLGQEIERRGGIAGDAERHKNVYLERLSQITHVRLISLAEGELSQDDLMIPGTRAFLDELARREIPCYLVSGTDEDAVRHEADLLRITPYFREIWGARPDRGGFTKSWAAARIAETHDPTAHGLVSFGDSPADVAAAVNLGGIGIGVAYDEAGARGANPAKRARLVAAGADVIVEDFRSLDALVGWLFGS